MTTVLSGFAERARNLESNTRYKASPRRTWRGDEQRSVLAPASQHGLSNLWKSIQLDNSVAMATRVFAEEEHEPVKGYNIWEDPRMRGKEHLMQYMLYSKSPNETFSLLQRYAKNDRLREELEYNEASWSRFFGGVLDPINWIPLPGLRGITFTRGVMRGAGYIGATSVATEVALQKMDPTRPVEEMYMNIGTGYVLGGGLGGVLGAWKIHGGYRDADAGWGQGQLYARMRNFMADRFNINSIGRTFDEGMRQSSVNDANLVASVFDDLSPFIIDHMDRFGSGIGVNETLHTAISARLEWLQGNIDAAKRLSLIHI